jgi:hypothetical protein
VLIAAPLLLVGGSWQEITAGPTASDVAAPGTADPAGSADSDQAGDDDDALQENAGPAGEADSADDSPEPEQPSSTQDGGGAEGVP